MKPTLIFDLGGVVLPLKVEATQQKFLDYTGKDIKEWMQFGYPHQLIQKFELGKITEKEFFEELRDLLAFDKELYYLKEAWNAMLLPIPKENITYLQQLANDYYLILLSNTCETHIQCFENTLQQTHQVNTLEAIFNKVYYSCKVGLRKPNPKLFQKVIKENNLNIEYTIYFDDTKEHINAAEQLGIKSFLYPRNELLRNTLPDILKTCKEVESR